MTDPVSTDLVAELREAVISGRGNYGHRVLCGKAADEIERLLRDRPVFEDLTRSVSSQLDEIERLRDAIDEHMRTVCNSPKAAGRGADEKLWALVAHDVSATTTEK